MCIMRVRIIEVYLCVLSLTEYYVKINLIHPECVYAFSAALGVICYTACSAAPKWLI